MEDIIEGIIDAVTDAADSAEPVADAAFAALEIVDTLITGEDAQKHRTRRSRKKKEGALAENEAENRRFWRRFWILAAVFAALICVICFLIL